VAITRVLGAEQVAAIVRHRGRDAVMDELIERLQHALSTFDGHTVQSPRRRGFHYEEPSLGLLEWMPVMDTGRVISVKTVGYHPTNPARQRLPSIVATTSLYDPCTGRLTALVEATLLTALRTGAASAIATDILARPDPVVVGVVGCGAQAVAQLHAISRVRAVETVLATDTDPGVAASFARRTGFLDRPVKIVDPVDRHRLLAEADVLCTCTSVAPGEGPVVDDGPHRPWLHVNAIGADFPGKVELPLPLVERSLLCPDLLSQCRSEGEAQRVGPERLGPDLATLVQQRTRYEAWRNHLTVFDSTGWALEDLVVAEMMVDHAADLGIHAGIDLHAPVVDPHDPFEGLVG
jgi:ornithine cyclodeaminase/alanine dehydrogenase-like protein (mu-crystallin family)